MKAYGPLHIPLIEEGLQVYERLLVGGHTTHAKELETAIWNFFLHDGDKERSQLIEAVQNEREAKNA